MTTPTQTIPANRPVAARWPAACGSSKDPGTQCTSIASGPSRAARSAPRAPATSRCVMRSLKRAAMIANLRGPARRAVRRNFGARPAISVWQRRQQVPELVALGAEVFPVGLGRRNLDRHALGDVQTVTLEADDLLRVVVQEPDPPPLLPHVHEDATPLGLDPGERLVELEAAIAPARVEHVPGQAFGMHPNEHGIVAGYGAHHQGERHAAVDRCVVGDRAELTELGRELGRRDSPDQLFLVDPILDEVADRDHLEAMRAGELVELRHPGHVAVLVEHLADDAGRVAAGQAGEVDRGLRVARASQDPAGHRAERQDMPGTGQVVGAHQRVDERPDRHRAVVGGGPGRHTPPRVDGDRERRSHRRRVVRDHHRDLEVIQALAEQRDADQAAAVLGHEVHRLGCHPVGRHDEVAFVLPVLVVHHEQQASLPDLLDPVLDGRKPGHVIPLRANERTRYLPITSTSRFVACPGVSRPSVVTASVCGISITSKLKSANAATVRLTPSTATDPWGISSGSSSRPGSVIRTRAVDSTRVTASTVPTPSTWPRTRWPPSAPPNRRGRSRLTGSPAARRARAVRLRVSGPTANVNPPGRRSTTVRHTPFTAMLPPTSVPSPVTAASTSSVAAGDPTLIARTAPSSSTIPVNISRPVRLSERPPRSGGRRPARTRTGRRAAPRSSARVRRRRRPVLRRARRPAAERRRSPRGRPGSCRETPRESLPRLPPALPGPPGRRARPGALPDPLVRPASGIVRRLPPRPRARGCAPGAPPRRPRSA